MTLTWYGHSCFKLDFGRGGDVVFDPYYRTSIPGIELPEDLSADTVLVSHNHHDHDGVHRVRLSGKKPEFKVEKLETWHDEEKGAKRGGNTIHIVSFNGFKAAHFGDIGCGLTDKEIKSLGGLDLALVPVGGVYTITAAQAKAMLDSIKPRIIVPMHYRKGGIGFDVLSTVDDFLSLYEPERVHMCGNTLELGGGESGIYVMNV